MKNMKKILIIIPLLLVVFSLKSQITDTVPDIENNCLNGLKYYADSIDVYFSNDSVYISGIIMANCGGSHYLIRHTVQDSIYIYAVDSCIANCMCPFNFQTVIPINFYNAYNISFGYICSSYGSYVLHYMDTTVYRNGTLIPNSENLYTPINIFPNPTSSGIIIEGDDISNIFIFNEIGRLIYETKTRKDIDLTSFEKGIYIIKIISKEYSISKKLVKK